MNKGTKIKVLQILRENEKTRNSDALLIMEVYRKFYYMQDPVSHSKLLEIMKYENPDGICRWRRKIQNVEKLYRASNIVEEQRYNNIQGVREELGYTNSNPTL
jgi:hypothetical protein